MFNTIPHIYIINLKKDLSRKKDMKKKIKILNCSFEFFDAIDGSSLSSEYLKNYYHPKLAKSTYGQTLNLGELGCFLSHLFIYQDILKKKYESAIILEDDVILASDFVNVATSLTTITKKTPCRLIHFGNNFSYLNPILHHWHHYSLMKNYPIRVSTTMLCGTSGYWVHSQILPALIKHLVPLRVPIDIALFHPKIALYPSFILHPNKLISLENLEGSNIQINKVNTSSKKISSTLEKNTKQVIKYLLAYCFPYSLKKRKFLLRSLVKWPSLKESILFFYSLFFS